MRLRYLPDLAPGYGRVKCGRGYCYTNVEGGRITDQRTLNRLRSLVIPPAWKNVWISPSKKGHLQATGIDEDGRKQYLYHPEWTRRRQQKKLARTVAFGKALPHIRRQITKDLRGRELSKGKVTAIALKFMEETLVRVGSEQYLRKYGSHGLTTLKKKHVRVEKNEIQLRFRGKKGVRHEIVVRNKALASYLLELKELDGSYLFQYKNERGEIHRLDAVAVNTYIQQCTNVKFSSKDYRTWYAGFWAFRLLAQHPHCENEKACDAAIVSVLDTVSQQLGNTRAVCKHYYVPDSIIKAYKGGSLLPYFQIDKRNSRSPTKRQTEQLLLAFLECEIEKDG